MSHFSVLVIGEDIDRQLAPYHEFESTGINDEFVEEIDITEDVKESYEKWGDGEDELTYVQTNWFEGVLNLDSKDELDIENKHKYGYIVVKGGQVVKVVQRTNPNAKWDWYQLGGRWTGFLKLKPGRQGEVGHPGLFTSEAKEGYADQAALGDVDWQGMMDKAGNRASYIWDLCRKVAPEMWESWDSVRQRFPDLQEARRYYHSQPGREAVGGEKELGWMGDDILVDKEEYVHQARLRAVSSYAIVKDGVWYSRGKMGWFGLSSGDKEYSVWFDELSSLLDPLDDEVMISVVDCHI